MRVTLLLALLLTLCLSVAVGAADRSQYTLLQVQVVHRHGSRSALVDYNDSLICGYEYPCGYLNKEGQTMMVNTGSFLRERYTEDEEVVDPTSPFLTLESYNLTVSYTRSTDVLRTLQSADAVLRGLFPDLTAYFPAVHTVQNSFDTLLNSDINPILMVKWNYARPEERAACNSVVEHHFTPTTLTQVAAEVHYDGFCGDWENRLECAKTLCDIAHAYESTGQIQQYPLLKQNLDAVCAALVCSSRFLFSFNSSDAVQRSQGSGGQLLAQQIVQNMKAKINGTSVFHLLEYSAHDTTLSPLAASLGDDSDTAMMPPFGTTYVFELLRRSGASSNSTSVEDYAVRVMRGHPGVTPDTNFTFAWDNFQLRCMGASGKEYVAEYNVCPLEDFIRYIDSSKPTHAAGLCYIDPVLLQRMNCSSSTVAFDLTSDCLKYRQLCPSVACGEGSHVALADLNCYRSKVENTTVSTGTSTGVVVLVAFLMLALGAVLCYGGQLAYEKYKNSYGRASSVDIELVEV